jgi:sugar-specific transcriptional regulator TrmB
MSKKLLLTKLQNIGLNDKEAEIYLACLRHDSAPVSQIAKTAKLNRVTTYSILKKMYNKGQVELKEKNEISYYQAVPPEILAENAKQQARDFADSLPEIKALAGRSVFSPTIRYFEGLDGVKSAYYETLKSETEILSYANSRNIRLHWPNYDQEYVGERKRKEIFLRGIAPDDESGQKVSAEDANYYRKMRLAPKEFFSSEQLENEINIYSGRMMIASFDPYPFAIIIKSSAVYETQKEIFEAMWRFAR